MVGQPLATFAHSIFQVLLIFACTGTALAQQPQPYRVGVVLSGGGAKGLAHIGVLRVLEEAGIRVDYVGGTSMGAIIGGLYASGWSAAALDSLARANNLGDIMQDRTIRAYQPFFEKMYGEKHALSLSFKDFKVALPQAISNGQSVFDFLSALTDRVSGIEDFSQLPIPFLCIGTDVSDGSQVVFERGNLARALRGSGALPGVISPVEVDGRLIADGGIVNNFPAREVREKGVDIVIGVTVEAGLYEKDQLQSIEKIIEQLGSYRMEARSREQLEFCDSVIRPDISRYGVTSFDDTDSILLRGEQAARAHWDWLTEIARRQREAPQPPARTPSVHADEDCPMYLTAIHVAPNQAITARALQGKFAVQPPCEMSFAEFRDGIAALYATGDFQFIDYHFVTAPGNIREVYIRPVVKPGYERSLRMGLHFDHVYKSGLLLNATFRNLLFKSSIAAFDLVIGDKPRYNVHYFVDRGRKPGFGFNSRLNTVDLFVDLPVQIDIGGNISVQNLLFDLMDVSNELYVNVASNNAFAVGLAVEMKYFKTSTSQAVNYLTDKNYIDERGWFAAGKAFFHYDTRDRIVFPRTGTLMRADARVIRPVSSLKYEGEPLKFGWNVDFRIERSRPLSARMTLHLAADAGITLGTPASPYRYFLGSNNRNLVNNFRPFVGLPFAEASGDNLLSTGVAFQYQLFRNHYVSLSGHIASLTEELKPYSTGAGLFRSVGLSYGVDTFLGPVEVTYGYSNRGGVVYFNLGYWF